MMKFERLDSARVAHIQWQLVHYPLPGAVGGSSVQVVDLIVCDVELSTGVVGFGFSYAIGGRGRASMMAAKELAEELVAGTELAPPEVIWRRLLKACNRIGRGPNFVGIAALDVALWDAYAISLGVPLGVAMGGAQRAIPVYGSSGYRPNQTADEVQAQIREHQDRGYQAVKLRLSGMPGDERLLRAAQETCGAKSYLMVDLNEKATLTQARKILHLAQECGALFVEEPLVSSDLGGYRALSRAYPGMIATGEHLQGLAEAKPFLDEGFCAVMQPDLAMIGGLSEALRVARASESAGIEIMPHFLPALFVHLGAAAPNLSWLEDFTLLEPLLEGGPEIVNGTLSMRDRPGHGLRLNADACDGLQVLVL